MPLQYNPEQPIALGRPPNPEQGPRSVPIILVLQNGIPISDDLALEGMLNAINNVQCVFIDNSANAAIFTLTFPDTGYLIKVKGNTQGFYPVICLEQVRYQALLAAAGTVRLAFLNALVPFAQWLSA